VNHADRLSKEPDPYLSVRTLFSRQLFFLLSILLPTDTYVKGFYDTNQYVEVIDDK